MSETLNITIKTEPWQFKSERMRRVLQDLGELPGLLDRIGEKIVRRIRVNLNGRLLNRRTGRLRNSWEWLVEPAGKGWQLEVASDDVVYARIQDLGGYAGRNHASFIKPTNYTRISIEEVKPITKLMRDWITSVTRD